MINDMVFDYTNSPVKVCAVGQDIVVKNSFGIGSLDPNELSPIPLTEEILVKNGFSEIHHPGTGATDEYSEWFFGGIKIIEWLEDWKYHYFSAGGDGAPIDFQYVHQLQHLLRLCGIEKEMEL